MEIWKNINLEYFNDRYLVSNYGRVKIINGIYRMAKTNLKDF